ncbi:ATP-dependent Clp protease ATP-binding subunit [Faecalicatena contorta]|uniref:AAA family ATPase n=1 Tax=Faecalicatena contorta TaxID=39482 RepID=UPI001F39E618|nr:AAA family ATPase [Faecalicatena contorta]MCF2679135.1 ATP-dependent Clp protease ATP-binding subunit [Faecalicatena contorta]
MVHRIIIFYGSKRDYEKIVKLETEEFQEVIPFMELIQHYNARLRPNESGVGEDGLYHRIEVEACIVRADDYASVLEHVLSNFSNIVSVNHDIELLMVHNPPKRVRESLETYYDNIEYLYSEYPNVNRIMLKVVYKDLCKNVLGQQTCKQQIISGLYKLISKKTEKPVVLMLYGPSGVGKTESAKSISRSLGGELLRIQFSMMQTEEAYNYVFGAGHAKSSLAKDMLGRESNVVLIDEFDKVNPVFYNAFYELFDEGKYVDSNYNVDLKDTVFLCTCNFNSEEEIKHVLGPAMYSRIGCCVKFEQLEKEQKEAIITSWYDTIVARLQKDEKDVIKETDILKWFLKNVGRYDNIRLLKTKIENAIYNELTEKLVIKVDE